MLSKILITATVSIVAVIVWYYYLITVEGNENNEVEFNGSGVNSAYGWNSSEPPQTKNFKASEFDCKDGTKVPKEYYNNLYSLMINLQVLRDYTGLPVFVNSGWRSVTHNRKEGGASKSTHLYALAGDIVVIGMSPKQVVKVIEQLIKEGLMQEGGLSAYSTFTHYDVRGYKARW